MSNDQNTENLGTELLKGFHTQFAENQRTREQSFLKIVGFLGAIVFGYAYAYQHLSAEDNKAFSYTTISSIILLLFGGITVIVIAYSFRRDQYENARIRKYAGIIGDGKPFPSDYNPYHIFDKKYKYFFWMPDIFGTFYLLFLIFQILILVSYSTRQNFQLSIWHAHVFETSTVIICIACIIICLIMIYRFGYKLKKKFYKWESEYPTVTNQESNQNSEKPKLSKM